MRLKSLELFGFKSFADKTLLDFQSGVTGVVGPNGCGKSNLVDAIRWVMGEMSAKHLRGLQMQDVIFNGTDQRPPLNMSQVSLTFDLTDGRAPAGFADYTEIQIERRLYRTGESEYYLNKVPCRLRDIIDLFLGTGVGTKAYSIIEQGKIGQILSAKPEERRLIIEEAAGISKFKHRRESALRRMEATQTNLARLADIVSEIKRQLDSLDRQARKAERYKKIYEELKEKDLRFAAVRYQRVKEDIETKEHQLTVSGEEEAVLGANLSQVDVEMEKERVELSEAETALNQLQERLYSAKNSAKLYEASIGYQENQVREIQSKESSYADEISRFRKKLSDLEKDLDKLNQSKVQADLSVATSSDQVSEGEQGLVQKTEQESNLKVQLESLQSQILDCVRMISEAQSKLEQMERQGIDVAGRISQAKTEIDAIDKRRNDLKQKLTAAEKDLSDLKQLQFNLVHETGSLKGDLEQKSKALSDAEIRLEEVRADLARKESRLHSLEELKKNLEGVQDGVKEVLKRSREADPLKGIVGTVNEMIDTDPQYEPAVGAALGEKLQYVVVESHEEGMEALSYLKQASKGRGTFVPLQLKTRTEGSSVTGQGVVGPMIDYVRFSDDYRTVAQYLFGDVVLVDDLRNALNLWRHQDSKKTYVTLDGEMVDAHGAVSGGSRGSAEQALLGYRRKVEDLSREISVTKASWTEVQKEALRVKAELQSMEEQFETVQQDRHEEELRLVNQERDGTALRVELGRYDQDRDRLSVQIAALTEEEAEINKEKLVTAQTLDAQSVRQLKLEQEKNRLEQEILRSRKEVDGAQQKLTTLKIRFAQEEERAATVEREINHLIRAKVEMTEGVESRIQEINIGQQNLVHLEKEIQEGRHSLAQALKEVEVLSESQRKEHDAYRKRTNALQNQNAELRQVRKRHEELVKQTHELSIALTELRGEARQLCEQMMERYKEDLSVHSFSTLDSLPADWDEKTASAEVLELRERLEKIGSVHVGAIEEYDELRSRYDFLSKQKEDLEKSVDDLRRAIQKINRTSRERFSTAFEMVNERFQQIFPKLFNGGRAKLMLIDEENMLESGVEIYAQPPGKKLQSITLLSGGEKALTAVALIFAIFLIKPSPFCLLDEVDAPLDDANIDRFNDMVRTMTPHSQFILITHNKRTMERGDVLYGVTMQEPGVSKIVSVKLAAGENLPKEVAVA